jgi:tetratricopeptide (TPR) repeat protein
LVDTQPAVAKEPAAPPPEAAEAPVETSEERYLARAKAEHAKGHIDAVLWDRAMAQAGNDKDAATGIYLETRATAIRVKKRQERAARKAQVVEALSQPDHGLDLPLPVAEAAASKPTRRGGQAKRKLMMLAAGVLACALATAGVVVLWPASDPAPGSNLAKAAATDPARAKPSARTTAPTTSQSADATSDEVLAKVQALEKEGNWNLLVIYTTEWTRKQPFNPLAWKTLSVGYVRLRQFTEALDTATKATQLAPEDASMWQNLGQINLAVPRPAEALAAFERATALNDKDIVSLAQEATLNVQLGHLAEAKVALDRAMALNPDDVPTLCGAASLAQKEGRVKDAEAMTLRVARLDVRCPMLVEGQSVRVASAPTPSKSPASTAPRAP